MNNLQVPTHEQCLKLREAGFPQSETYFVYHAIWDFDNHQWISKVIERNSPYVNLGALEGSIFAAPTLGEINLVGDYYCVFFAYGKWHLGDFVADENPRIVAQDYSVNRQTFDTELDARIALWLLSNQKPSIYEPSPLQKLIELQKQVGYKAGEIRAVAVLGLFGEAGEVLNELEFESRQHLELICSAVSKGFEIDKLKKQVRDKLTYLEFQIEQGKEEIFDLEMSDVLYYLNALALGRGKTLEYYAQLSYEKVSKKLQIDVSQGIKNLENGGLLNPKNDNE